jgi:hypothetical protein
MTNILRGTNNGWQVNKVEQKRFNSGNTTNKHTFDVSLRAITWQHLQVEVMTHWVLLAALAACSAAVGDSRIPPEVRYKSGYINRAPRPPEFKSAMLWGIAIADTRVHGFEKAQVEIRYARLSCRVDGNDVVLNDDTGAIRGGLYQRYPWFGTDAHGSMPLAHSHDRGAVILRVGERSDRVWHFWAASPRKMIPAGDLQGCTVKVQAKVSRGALLQVGFDYWRNPTVGYGAGGNNHEGGASNWYFPLDDWQEAVFSDVSRSSSR